MIVPSDIANLFVVAVRDVIWYKDSVLGFLASSGVPPAIRVEAKRLYSEKKPTIPVMKHVLERCASSGDESSLASRKMLTDLYYWKDLHTIPKDRRDQAIASLKAYQEAFGRFRAQAEYQEAQRKQERRMDAERTAQRAVNKLDHEKLHTFRDEYDRVAIISDEAERGRALEPLMERIFGYYAEDSKGPIRRTGEQIDGLIKLDSHWHYVEIRWKTKKTSAADISVLRDRARSGFGGDTRALFISINGFSQECIASLVNRTDERVILMDGYDLRCVLNCDIGLDVLLAEKQARIVRDMRPFVSAGEIMQARRQGDDSPEGRA